MFWKLRMPGRSHRGALPILTPDQERLAQRLRDDVETLTDRFGPRNEDRYQELLACADWISTVLSEEGHEVRRQGYEVRGKRYENLDVEVPGFDRPEEIVVVGAHYDTVPGSPGANDNGSGLVALLELARRFASRRPRRTLRLVAFVNEEMPHFMSGSMGSQVYARACRRRGDHVTAMVSLETIGYYRDGAGTQQYPPPLSLLYPTVGNFLGFVGNLRSNRLLREAVGAFRTHARFPSEGASLPALVPGVSWSDHSSFWSQGYPAIMITDTAPFRYPHYHTSEDTPDKLDYPRLARVVDGIDAVVTTLTGGVRPWE
jgi:Zn-dependent M28 family amino/carboxypeptidase